MALSAGTRLGPYELLSLLGRGGMGEVYKARDTRLDRVVALKILPPAAALKPGMERRFIQEARAASSLNHPNIVHIYDVGEDNGTRFIAMEYVAGVTLQKKIGRGLGLSELLDYAIDMASALARAHAVGIVHRDLKPSNVMITTEGVAKILDFGVAKLLYSADDPEMLTQTAIASRTGENLPVGSVAYMSPEQAECRAVDARSDIFSFGAVVYEMATGSRAFPGDSTASTLASVLREEPVPIATIRDGLPADLQRVVLRCLRKDPARRFQHMDDVGVALHELNEEIDVARAPSPAAVSARGDALPSSGDPAPFASTRSRTMLIGVAPVVVVGVVIAAAWFSRSPDIGTAARLSISAPGQLTPQTSVAISPDGRRVAFVSTDPSGRSMLWIRELDSLKPRVLAGTEDAAHPFWSPDGSALGFLGGGKLKRVDVGGGGVLTLADVTARFGGSWSSNGKILFVPRVGELATVSATGGRVTTVLAWHEALWPFFLPDGRHFLFQGRSGRDEPRGVHVGSLDSKKTARLLTTDFKAAYADPGYVIFVRDEALLAQPFDAVRLQLSGEPTVIAEGIWVARAAAQASFSVSPARVLSYVNASLWNSQLTWVDRAGRSIGSFGKPDRYFDQVPQIAPGGSRLAIARGPFGDEDIWVMNLTGAGAARLTFDAGTSEPAWSSDGRRVLFQSRRGANGLGLYLKDSDGAGSEVAVDVVGGVGHLWDWSRDGRFIVYARIGDQGAADLWVLPLAGDRKPFPFAQSAFHKTQAQISPNGRWIAYTSYESGRDEVYVQSFPAPGSRRQISAAGGVQPRWRRDGAELFYLASDQTLMAVPVRIAGAFDIGQPSPLFRSRILPQGSQSIWFDTAFDVTADGQRFLINGPPEDPGPPMTVVLNWTAALKK
jgi:Tol biopolymer transport system component